MTLRIKFLMLNILFASFSVAQVKKSDSIQQDSVTLGTAVEKISKVHKVNFLYEDGMLDSSIDSKIISSLDRLSLSEGIKYLEMHFGLEIKSVDGQNFSISKKKKQDSGSFQKDKNAYSPQLVDQRKPLVNTLNGEVYGKILTESEEPLGFITVSLRSVIDSGIVKVDITDESGNYQLQQIPKGEYFLEASMVGMGIVNSKAFLLLEGASFQVPEIFLKEISRFNVLDEVVVTAKKPLVERKIDRTVVNVENTSLSAGGTINDILKIAPGVSVDDGKISLRGKKGVIVMVDDRRMNLSSSDVARMLENMPAEQVRQIELITNPSAKYDAEGGAGIINIVTKKNINTGFSATLVSGFRIGTEPKFNEGINMNFRKNKVNLFGNYNYSNNRNISEYISDKDISNEGGGLFYNQTGNTLVRRIGSNARAGMDYHLTDNHTIGFLLTMNNGRALTDEVQDINYRKPMTTLIDSTVKSNNRGRSTFDMYSMNLNSRHKLGEKGELLFNADYLTYKAGDPNTYNNVYSNLNGNTLEENVFNSSSSSIKLLTAKMDYSKELHKGIRFDAGVKTSFSSSSSDIKFERELKTGEREVDPLRTNAFDYDEYINSAYLNLYGKLGENTEWQVGLRGENTKYNGVSLTTGERIDRNYFQLFPSLFLLHKLNKANELGFSYGRRIGRPDYADLNPFIDYSSPLFYTQGNPTLLPETTDNYEVNYTYVQKLNLSVGFSRTNNYFNYFTSISDPATGATKQTVENFKHYDSWFAGLNYGEDLFKWWDINGNINVYHNRFQAPILEYFVDMKMTSVDLNIFNTFKLSDKLSFDLLGIYRSPKLGIARRIDSRYSVDFGARYRFNERFLIRGGVTDIFYTDINKGTNNLGNLYSTFYNRNENRRFNISLSYRFGGKLNAPKKKLSNEDEVDRIGN